MKTLDTILKYIMFAAIVSVFLAVSVISPVVPLTVILMSGLGSYRFEELVGEYKYVEEAAKLLALTAVAVVGILCSTVLASAQGDFLVFLNDGLESAKFSVQFLQTCVSILMFSAISTQIILD